MVLGSLAYAIVLAIVQHRLCALWLGYFFHGIGKRPEAALKLYSFGYARGARAGAPMLAYAMLLMELCRYEEALTVLREVQHRTDLNHFMQLLSRQDLALALEKTGDVPAAIEEMEKIRQEYESLGSNFYSNLAYFYIQAGAYEKAEEINEKAGEEEKSGAYYDNLALVAYRRADYVQAETLFKKALEVDSSMVSPQYHLGILAEMRGDADAAADYFRAASETGVTGLSTITRQQLEEKCTQYRNEMGGN
jgi:tetratricopeptide (TPR) repeat protein